MFYNFNLIEMGLFKLLYYVAIFYFLYLFIRGVLLFFQVRRSQRTFKQKAQHHSNQRSPIEKDISSRAVIIEEKPLDNESKNEN